MLYSAITVLGLWAFFVSLLGEMKQAHEVSRRKVAQCSPLLNENTERLKWCGQRERSGVARETEVVWPERQKWCGLRDRSAVARETEVV